MTAIAVITREAWLIAAIEALRPRFVEVGMPLPERIHVSVGFGFGSPEVNDTARILDILLHELIHAADDCKNGHKGAFAEAATRLGLTGKMTATVASIELAAEFITLAETLGSYPHGALTAATLMRAKEPVPAAPDGGTGRISSGPKAQTARMLKVVCPEDGYTVRTTAKWIAVGMPSCPCGTEMVAD